MGLNFLIWLSVGGLIGWGASLLLGTQARHSILNNIIVGVVGAFVAGLVLAPLLGVSTLDKSDFSFSSMMLCLLGAVVLVAAVYLLWLTGLLMGTDERRGRVLVVFVGVASTLVAGLVLTPLFETNTPNVDAFNFASVMLSLVGASFFLAVATVFRRWTAH
jgi:uncharacterized membrane protein YeaQ/YmgE (transglycosylase-associated protein family)